MLRQLFQSLRRPAASPTKSPAASSGAPSLAASCVYQLIDAWAEQTPDATAVEFQDVSVSYAELKQRTDRLASHLTTLGVSPDQLVGLMAPRGVDLIVGMLGIMKAGGAYVPLDPNYPRERLQFMAADAELNVLLTTPQLAAGVRVLYGGSVNAKNVGEIVAQEDVDGALVGGASLDGEQFATLAAIAAGGPLP